MMSNLLTSGRRLLVEPIRSRKHLNTSCEDTFWLLIKSKNHDYNSFLIADCRVCSLKSMSRNYRLQKERAERLEDWTGSANVLFRQYKYSL